MKYVYISYDPVTNLADIGIYSDEMIDSKFTENGLEFIVYHGRTLPIVFSSEYDSKIRDFCTFVRLGYQGLGCIKA